MAHRTSVQPNVRRRARVVTSVAMSKKNTRAFRYWSVSSDTLPPGQSEKGIVITAQTSSANAVSISGPAGITVRRRIVDSSVCARIARPAATSAMRSVFNAGISVCGVSRRIPVNATSAPNASRLPVWPASARATATVRSGRHQVLPASSSFTLGLRYELLPPGHPNRSVEQLDIVEVVVAEPAEDCGIQVLELVRRRVPIERIQPAPAPVAFHRDRQRQPQRFADN